MSDNSDTFLGELLAEVGEHIEPATVEQARGGDPAAQGVCRERWRRARGIHDAHDRVEWLLAVIGEQARSLRPPLRADGKPRAEAPPWPEAVDDERARREAWALREVRRACWLLGFREPDAELVGAALAQPNAVGGRGNRSRVDRDCSGGAADALLCSLDLRAVDDHRRVMRRRRAR